MQVGRNVWKDQQNCKTFIDSEKGATDRLRNLRRTNWKGTTIVAHDNNNHRDNHSL